MGEPAQNLPRPCSTPPSGLKRGRKMVALEDLAKSSVTVPASPDGSRSIRRRTNCRLPSQDGISSQFPEMSHACDFLVYLPNTTFVEVRVDGALCKNLTVQGFVELVRIFEESKTSDTKAKEKQVVRKIQWNNAVYIQDFEGNPVNNGEFITLGDEIKAGKGLLLYDNHTDSVHAHPDFWNVTPEPEMLSALPQDYTVFSALADELDNSLQAVYQLPPGKKRLICVDLDHTYGKIIIYDTGKGMDSTSQSSISKWGTIGASMNRHSVSKAIGGKPPYLKPNFGMYGFGGIGAGFHLGGYISVSSKTERSGRVAVLHVGKDTLKTSVKPGRVWKTGGEFRSPTAKELEWSPHGSFTKVEISDLNREIPTWKVTDVQRKLKDFYFPYIQNDEGIGGTTFRPVEIRVNGLDLAEVLGGEVAHSNYYSGNGEPYVLILEFTKETTTADHAGGVIVEKANARITCRYYPIKQGIEAIDDIIKELTDEDPELVGVDFDTFSRRSIRRLGRLLPDARGEKPLPFMEPKRNLKANEVNRHWYKRAKAFIDVDAGFKPTLSKMDLASGHSFNEALLNLGRGPQNVDNTRTTARATFREPGLVTVSIKQKGAVIKPDQLHAHYSKWITMQHDQFDTGAEFNESSIVIVSQPHHKKELNISDDVFRVVYDIKCRDIHWEIGKGEDPIRLKLQKGIPGLNNNDMILYVTVECFISEGFSETPGEARIICRPMGVPEERGSKEILGDEDREPDFILGPRSRVFPIEDILFTNKYERVDEEVWLKQVEKVRSKSPAFVELLNEQEVSKLGGHESLPKYASIKAGAALPAEIIAVVRPRMCKPRDKLRDSTLEAPRLEQKFIIAEAMEMTLIVRKMKYHPHEVRFPKRDMSGAEKVYETKLSASTRCNLKGLYSFSTKGTLLESITQTTGTYFFFFTLVSAKHQDVDDFMVRMNVTPSSKIGQWNIFTHSGTGSDHQNRSPEVMKVRLGGVLPRNLYLSRVDEFSNPMGFEEIPSDIACSIYTVEGNQVTIPTTISKIVITNDLLNLEIAIKIGEGNLEPLKPTMQAVFKMAIANVLVASFLISVLPGEASSARICKNEAPDNHLHPGQIIEQMVFEILDNCQNPVSSGRKVKVVLEGFVLQDKNGHLRSVDRNGCVDLGMRLRVTSGYGKTARVELRSTEDLSLLEKTFAIIDRKLQIKNKLPDYVAVGSQLVGIEIEAVDESGEVDYTMDGTDHSLTMEWNPTISVPLHQGRCTLPPITMPSDSVLWDKFVAHTHYPNLRTDIKVWVEYKVESQDNDLIAADDPYDLSKNLVALSDNSESKALVLREVPLSESDRQNLPDLLLSSKVEFQIFERKLVRLGQKMKQHEDQLDRLQRMQREYGESTRQYHDELDSLKVGPLETLTIISKDVDLNKRYNQITEENQVALNYPTLEEDQLVEPYNTDTEQNPGILGCAAGQVEMQIAKLGYPPGTNAATILLRAQHEQHCEISEDVIGIVALLGAVETEELNRALVEFLGLENMLAIICRSRSAAECIGIPSIGGIRDKNKGLSSFAKSHNLEISGRFRVMTLTDESCFFKRVDGHPAVDNTHPQKILNMGPISNPGSGRPEGSIGYAANMIQLSEEQLDIRVSGGHGLRESLFFMLFGFLEVFNTTDNMLKAWKDIRTSAVSLDGGLIRTNNQFELGSREDPAVWFPTWYPPVNFEQPSSTTMHEGSLVVGPPQPLESITPFKIARPVQHLKRKEVMKKMKDAHQLYITKGVEGKIQKVSEQIQRTRKKIETANQQLKDSFEKFNLVPERERISKLNLQAQNLNFKLGRRVC